MSDEPHRSSDVFEVDSNRHRCLRRGIDPSCGPGGRVASGVCASASSSPTEIGSDAGAVRAYGEAVAGLGFDHVLAYDHVLGADPGGHPGFSGPYTAASVFHEPLVLYGFLAAVAPGLELVTGILILPQRQTALVAKQAAEVDLLTGGRFRLGVGLGWNQVEYEALGMTFADRGRRVEEQIEVLGGSADGRQLQGPIPHDHSRRDQPPPRPAADPDLDGRLSEPALKRTHDSPTATFRAARRSTAGGARPSSACAGGDSKPAETLRALGIEARIHTATGSPGDWRRQAAEWQTLGATHLSINTMGGGLTDQARHRTHRPSEGRPHGELAGAPPSAAARGHKSRFAEKLSLCSRLQRAPGRGYPRSRLARTVAGRDAYLTIVPVSAAAMVPRSAATVPETRPKVIVRRSFAAAGRENRMGAASAAPHPVARTRRSWSYVLSRCALTGLRGSRTKRRSRRRHRRAARPRRRSRPARRRSDRLPGR